METKRFIVRDSLAGNIIDSFDTSGEAKRKIEVYEDQDKDDGLFEENFYEIYDTLTEEIV